MARGSDVWGAALLIIAIMTAHWSHYELGWERSLDLIVAAVCILVVVAGMVLMRKK